MARQRARAHSRACSGEREDDVISVTPLLSYCRRPRSHPIQMSCIYQAHYQAAPLNCVIIALSAGNSNLSEAIHETWISAAYMKANLNLPYPPVERTQNNQERRSGVRIYSLWIKQIG